MTPPNVLVFNFSKSNVTPLDIVEQVSHQLQKTSHFTSTLKNIPGVSLKYRPSKKGNSSISSVYHMSGQSSPQDQQNLKSKLAEKAESIRKMEAIVKRRESETLSRAERESSGSVSLGKQKRCKTKWYQLFHYEFLNPKLTSVFKFVRKSFDYHQMLELLDEDKMVLFCSKLFNFVIMFLDELNDSNVFDFLDSKPDTKECICKLKSVASEEKKKVGSGD